MYSQKDCDSCEHVDDSNESVEVFVRTGYADEVFEPAAVGGGDDGEAGDGIWSGSCVGGTEYFRDPEDCSKYYHCAHGTPYEKSCASGLVFDLVNLICNTAANVNS